MVTSDSQLKLDVGTEARTLARQKCDLETGISVPWGDRWDCKIVDMNERGFGIVTSARLRKGDMVNVEIPKSKAKVVWMKDNRAGLRVAG